MHSLSKQHSRGNKPRHSQAVAKCLAGTKRIRSPVCPYPSLIWFNTQTLCPHHCIRGHVHILSQLLTCPRHWSPHFPSSPLCVNAHDHLVSHILSLSLNPFFIALVVIKCAMCTSIQVVCTPNPPLYALQSCQNHPHLPSLCSCRTLPLHYSLPLSLTWTLGITLGIAMSKGR